MTRISTTRTTASAISNASSTTPTRVMITTPTLIVDQSKCLANIHRMADKARHANAKLRPHCKTHACLEISRWMRNEGNVDSITVSSLSMAEYFSQEWEDITVAFPINILEINTINRLAGKISNLNLVVENIEAVEFLQERLEHPVGVWMKIDTGYGRTGIPADDVDRIQPILDLLRENSNNQSSSLMNFQGFLTHAGHTYGCREIDEVRKIHQETKRLLFQLKDRFLADFPNLQLSVGDTPSCSILPASEFEGLDEMRPGNFVFYDVEQSTIGSCQPNDIAVALACPIVAKHPQRHEIILYGGGVHFSKDRLGGQPEGTIFGRVVARRNESLEWGDIVEGMYLKGVSQEHGKVVVPSGVWDDYNVGDLLFVLPVHSCMTADVLKHKGYLTTDFEHLDRMKN